MPRLSFAPFTVLTVRIAAAALGISLLLTGCQGGSSPGSPPSETGSTTASPTPRASGSVAPAVPSGSAKPSGVYKPADAKGKAQNVPVPVMPELAKENTKEGLEAFIRYWYATFSYATESGNVEPWVAITDTQNIVAAAYKEALGRNYAQGRWMVGGKITTPAIEILWAPEGRTQEAKVQVIQEQISYVNADGTPGKEPTPPSNIAEAVFTEYASGSWRVTDNGMIVG